MNHAMIDLETLGTTPSSVFTSIAIVQFDINTGELGKILKVNVDIDSSLQAGRTIQGSTIKWWSDQRKEIMAKMFENPVAIKLALARVWNFISNNNIEIVWGNSASFDITMLNDAFRKFDIHIPWKYSNEMCYRTMSTRLGKIFNIEVPYDDTKAHDPLYDCERQIQKLVMIENAVRNHKHMDSEMETDRAVAITLLHEALETLEEKDESLIDGDILTRIKNFLDGITPMPVRSSEPIVKWEKREGEVPVVTIPEHECADDGTSGTVSACHICGKLL